MSEWRWEHIKVWDYCNGCGKQAVHVQRVCLQTRRPVFEWCSWCGLEVDYTK